MMTISGTDSVKDKHFKIDVKYSIYVYGSNANNLHSIYSDIDFLIVTEERLSKYDEKRLRINFLEEQSKLFNHKIGIKIISKSQLNDFFNYSLTWTNNISNSKLYFGTDIIKNYDFNYCFNPTIIYQNVIERLWYDQLYIKPNNTEFYNLYLVRKSIKSCFGFILYLNNKIISEQESRDAFLNSNSEILKNYYYFDFLKSKSYSKLDNIKNKIYNKISVDFLQKPLFADINLTYWKFDKLISRSLNDNEKWHMVLLKYLLDLDDERIRIKKHSVKNLNKIFSQKNLTKPEEIEILRKQTQP